MGPTVRRQRGHSITVSKNRSLAETRHDIRQMILGTVAWLIAFRQHYPSPLQCALHR